MYIETHSKPERAWNLKLIIRKEVYDLLPGRKKGWFRKTLWLNKDNSNAAEINAEIKRMSNG